MVKTYQFNETMDEMQQTAAPLLKSLGVETEEQLYEYLESDETYEDRIRYQRLHSRNKKDSSCWQQLKRSRPNGPYQLYISPEIILEIRDKLETKFHWDRKASTRYVEAILVFATLVHPKQKVTDVLKDTDDHIILECAIEAKAKAIATADRGLLRLKEFRTDNLANFKP